MSARDPDAVVLLFDSRSGHIPQRFAEECLMSGIWTISGTTIKNAAQTAADVAILLGGPENPYYWDAWDSVSKDARLYHESGVYKRYIGDDGDLFALCEERMTLDEHQRFFDGTEHYVVPEGCIVYTMQTVFLPALINDDWTGLEDDDAAALKDFIERNGNDVVDYLSDSAEWGTCDVTGDSSDVTEVVIKQQEISE